MDTFGILLSNCQIYDDWSDGSDPQNLTLLEHFLRYHLGKIEIYLGMYEFCTIWKHLPSLDYGECTNGTYGDLTWLKCNENFVQEKSEPITTFTDSKWTLTFLSIHLVLHILWCLSSLGLLIKDSKPLQWPWYIVTTVILMFSPVLTVLYMLDVVEAVVSMSYIVQFHKK